MMIAQTAMKTSSSSARDTRPKKGDHPENNGRYATKQKQPPVVRQLAQQRRCDGRHARSGINMCRHRGPPEKLVLPKRFEISQLGGRLQKCRPSRPLGKLCLTGRSYRAQFDPTSADHRRSSFSDLVKRNAFSSCANARAAAELNTARLRSEAAEATVLLRRLAGHGRRRVTIGAVGARSAAVVARSNVGGGSRLYHHHWATRLQLSRHNEQPYYQQGNSFPQRRYA
jgi:hypothetical protein